jgi:adhesin/invasin
MNRNRRLRTEALAATAWLGLVGMQCGEPPAPLLIALEAGHGQTAIVGTAVLDAPSVKVTRDGIGVADVGVEFAVTAGGGEITGATALTNGGGLAHAASWVLGTAAGSNTLTATVAGANPGPIVFAATAIAGPATTMSLLEGDGQTAIAGSALPVNPSVKLSDRYGNPAGGTTTVSFALKFTGSGFGSIAQSSVLPSGGVASGGTWTLGDYAAEYVLIANALSLPPVTFKATAIPGPPARIFSLVSNDTWGFAGAPVPSLPRVGVTDSRGNYVKTSVKVLFALPAGDNGTITGDEQMTTDGVAKVGGWTLSNTAGRPNVMTATAEGLAGSPVTFTYVGAGGAVVTTRAASGIAKTSLFMNGTVAVAEGTQGNGYFEYGSSTDLGSRTGSRGFPPFGTFTISDVMSGLNCGQTYYYRAVGFNLGGPLVRGDIVSATTAAC